MVGVRDHRDRPDRRPGRPPARSATCSRETLNLTGCGGESAPSTFGSAVFWYVFATGLLMAQYTITGFDASAHMAEETRAASRSAAVGMYMSVVASVIFGFILLVAVTFALPTPGSGRRRRLHRSRRSGWRRWARAGRTFLLFICCRRAALLPDASVTSASRMMFAFSRDGAVPGHRLWRRISSNRVPHMAVDRDRASLAAILMLPTLWNSFIGYSSGRAIAVIGLYIAFILPVILRYRMKRRVRARRLDARQALQVDRPDRDRLGRLHLRSSS